jgi:molecular chaperone DnaK (HSP70)
MLAVREGDNHPRLIQLGSNSNWIPSLAGLDSKGGLVVGEPAEKLPLDRQISDIKTVLGTGEQLAPRFGVDLETVISELLVHVFEVARKKDPTAFEGDFRIVVGCPSIWELAPRQTLTRILHNVGTRTGLQVLCKVRVEDLLEEPVAAGIGWISETGLAGEKLDFGELLVVDAGGGTLDLAVLGFGDPTLSTSEPRVRVENMFVLASHSLQGSGDKVDESVRKALEANFETSEATDIELARAAKRLKEDLSSKDSATEKLASVKSPLVVKRTQLEAWISAAVQEFVHISGLTTKASLLRYNRSVDPTTVRSCEVAQLGSLQYTLRAKRSQKDHEKTKQEQVFPEVVVMVGGTSLIPVFQASIKSAFPTSTVVVAKSPQSAVALGLTHADRVKALNMPKPPVDLVVQGIKNDTVVSEHVIVPAFGKAFGQIDVLKGLSHNGIRFEFEAGKSYRVGYKQAGQTKVEPLHPDLWTGAGWFKYYLTGEFVFRTKQSGKWFAGRITGWPQFGKSIEMVVQENSETQSPGYPFK